MQTRRKQILLLLALVALTSDPTARLVSAQGAAGSVRRSTVNQLQFLMPGAEEIPAPVDEASLDPGIGMNASQPLVDDGATFEMPDFGSTEQTADVFVDGPAAPEIYGLPIDDAVVTDAAPVFSTNNWFRGGYWYSQQEFVMLLRSNIQLVHVALDRTSLPGGVPLLTNFRDQGDITQFEKIGSKDADFTYEPGTRLTLGHALGRDVANRDHSVEFTFLGLFEYTGQAEIAPVNPNAVDPNTGAPLGIQTLLGSLEVTPTIFNPVIGFPSFTTLVIPAFTNADFQSIIYQSDLNTFEVNYRVGGRPGRDRLVMQPDGTWMRFDTPSRVQAMFAGFRYFRIDERFQYRSTTFRTEGGQSLPPSTGLYQVDTQNHAFGFQFGAELVKKETNWQAGVRGKAGGLINFTERDSLLSTNLPGADNELNNSTRQQNLSEESFAVLLEGGVFGAYYLRPNTSLRASYDVMLINGVATAFQNLGLMGTFPEFDVDGKALFHGASVGFEMTW